MFSTGSPYSPFFTSGLLSSPSPSSSRPQSPDVCLGPRRGSLPTDSPSYATSPDESAAFYFTLQPKRDETECRSFLSLDLAESQSLRSASLKRKVSANTSTPRLPSFSKFPSIPEVPQQLAPSPTPSRLRHSRSTIPSPKPAPSITLPDVPKSPAISSTPPRLPSLPIIPSIRFSLKPEIYSAPIITSRTVVKLPQRQSVLTTSTVSTRARRNNRSDALARLEGRSKAPITPASRLLQRRNFMSMSDEEDGTETDVEEFDFCDDAYMECEDVVLPASPPRRSSAPSTTASMKRRKQAQRQTKDWFPLQSFIDLHAEDETSRWSWRSFIEIATLV